MDQICDLFFELHMLENVDITAPDRPFIREDATFVLFSKNHFAILPAELRTRI
jgi:hypothetical protein